MKTVHVRSFSETKAHLSEVFDGVQHYAPAIVKPRKKSEKATILIGADKARLALGEDQVRRVKGVVWQEDDGSYGITLTPVGIVVGGEPGMTLQMALDEAVAELKEYAEEYLSPEFFPIYSVAPNRRTHLALVLQVALAESDRDISELIEIDYMEEVPSIP